MRLKMVFLWIFTLCNVVDIGIYSNSAIFVSMHHGFDPHYWQLDAIVIQGKI